MGDGLDWHLRSTCAIAVMAKASIPGQTKTRLVPPLSEDEAATLNTVFLRDAADNILSAAALANISGWMAYTPVGSAPFFRSHLPKSIGLLEAAAPSLGECLQFASTTLLRSGHGAVCLINSDSPTLPVGYLATAATALAAAGDRIVLGPATDGGYYLIGMKRPHPGLFEDIAWSTQQVAQQTLERAAELALPVHVLPTWYDVDDAEALRILQAELFEGRSFSPELRPNQPRHTRALMESMHRDSDLRGRLGFDRALQRAAE